MERIASPESLHNQMLEDTGQDLPIGIGSGLSIEDPINMLANVNYVHAEGEIFWFYLRKYSPVAWDVVSQDILVIMISILIAMNYP